MKIKTASEKNIQNKIVWQHETHGSFTIKSSWSDNLPEGLDKDKCKRFKPCLEYVILDGSLVFECVDSKYFHDNVANTFKNLYKFCDGYINKFSLM